MLNNAKMKNALFMERANYLIANKSDEYVRSVMGVPKFGRCAGFVHCRPASPFSTSGEDPLRLRQIHVVHDRDQPLG